MNTITADDVLEDFIKDTGWIDLDARYSIAVVSEDDIYSVFEAEVEHYFDDYRANLNDKYGTKLTFHGSGEVDIDGIPFELAGTYVYDSDMGTIEKVEA